MAGELGESLYEGEPDWLKKLKNKKPTTTVTPTDGTPTDGTPIGDGEGDAGDPGATSGNISSVFDSMKVDTSKFKKPDLVTKNTGSKALIAKLRAKRAKDPVDMYLNATKKKQEEETTFG
tara:strand:+ start:1720 stop:2079 length:360 start_codon:yes stop_codon:yes gene_type:complete